MTELGPWIERVFGHSPRDLALFERALTHSSRGAEDYERLEFLGDRVLGLCVAHWLIETYPRESEGSLADRLNALVAGSVCAEIARDIGIPGYLKLGRQAQDDGVFQSDNVLGDVVEALIGALYLEAGLPAAAHFVRRTWGDRVDRCAAPPKHPKAALQEWAAARKRKAPEYRVLATSGPDHAPTFTVAVRVNGLGEAEARGASKQEAETLAAKALLEKTA